MSAAAGFPQGPYALAPEQLALDAPGWADLRPGVRIRVLHEQERARLALLHYAPGASVPAHRHGGDEHIYVLSGSQGDERGSYPAGSYVFNPAGSSHVVSSPEGCLVLIHWLAPVEFI